MSKLSAVQIHLFNCNFDLRDDGLNRGTQKSRDNFELNHDGIKKTKLRGKLNIIGISNLSIFLSTLSAVKIHFFNYSFDLWLGGIKKTKLRGKLNIIGIIKS